MRAIGNMQSMKTLGVIWESHTDTFKGRAIFADMSIKLTKRTILQKLASVYDPLGIMAPFIIQCKILSQLIWIRGCEWDDEVEDDVKQKAIS